MHFDQAARINLLVSLALPSALTSQPHRVAVIYAVNSRMERRLGPISISLVRGTTDEYSLAVNNFAPSLLNSQIPLLLCVVVFEVLKLLSEETLQFFDTKF